jgi:hypothetical protein
MAWSSAGTPAWTAVDSAVSEPVDSCPALWTLAGRWRGCRGLERHARLLPELVPVAPKRRPGDVRPAGDLAQAETLLEPAIDLSTINCCGHDHPLSAPHGRGSTGWTASGPPIGMAARPVDVPRSGPYDAPGRPSASDLF